MVMDCASLKNAHLIRAAFEFAGVAASSWDFEPLKLYAVAAYLCKVIPSLLDKPAFSGSAENFRNSSPPFQEIFRSSR